MPEHLPIPYVKRKMIITHMMQSVVSERNTEIDEIIKTGYPKEMKHYWRERCRVTRELKAALDQDESN